MSRGSGCCVMLRAMLSQCAAVCPMRAVKPYGAKPAMGYGMLRSLILVWVLPWPWMVQGAMRDQARHASAPTALREALREQALAYVGRPYVMGGSGRRGFDCSGLVQHVFAAFGIHLPRSSSEQWRVGQKIPRIALEPGDLLFFATGRGTRINHVGIYIGRGRFVHAASSSRSVQVASLKENYFQRRLMGARRLLD